MRSSSSSPTWASAGWCSARASPSRTPTRPWPSWTSSPRTPRYETASSGATRPSGSERTGAGRQPAERRPRLRTSGQDRLDDVPGDVGQAEVAALLAVGEPQVVDAEEVEHGGMEVVDVDGVLDG